MSLGACAQFKGPVLKFLLFFEQGALRFHMSLGPANCLMVLCEQKLKHATRCSANQFIHPFEA